MLPLRELPDGRLLPLRPELNELLPDGLFGRCCQLSFVFFLLVRVDVWSFRDIGIFQYNE
jgi:hypothetical protein